MAQNVRNAIRARILGKKVRTELVTLKDEDGQEYQLEVRQPSVGMSFDLGNITDNKDRMVKMLVDHVFIPGTEEKLFDPEDRDVLLSLPQDEDYAILMDKILELGNANTYLEAAAKNSKATQANESSTESPTS
jgi:hypothetical protein